MASFMLLVYTRPIEGQADDYHRWYDETHLAEVLTVPGFIAARRFAVHDDAVDTNRCVAMFSIESDDISATMDAFDRARADMLSPRSLDASSVSFQLLRAIGPDTF
jgi:hypothetical protein